MATIQELRDKVRAAAERVSKISSTIAKHEARAAKLLAGLNKKGITLENMKDQFDSGSYEVRSAILEYESKLDEADRARKTFRDAEAILSNWQNKLHVATEKERFVNDQAPAVIIEFLNQWKEQARDWHVQGHARYLELKETIRDLTKAAEVEYRKQNPEGRTFGRAYDAFMKEHKELSTAKHQQALLGGVVARMATYRDEEERLAYLEKVLEEDRKVKMFDLINKVNEAVGTITDARYLKVNEKGNLDGIIIGEQGQARIETSGVGGYNIVCFHYRTNVWPIREAAPATTTTQAEEIPVVIEEDGQAALKLNLPSGGGEIRGRLGEQMYMNL